NLALPSNSGDQQFENTTRSRVVLCKYCSSQRVPQKTVIIQYVIDYRLLASITCIALPTAVCWCSVSFGVASLILLGVHLLLLGLRFCASSPAPSAPNVFPFWGSRWTIPDVRQQRRELRGSLSRRVCLFDNSRAFAG